MIQRLLVPLDGSDMAEEALPAAAYLAGKLSASVTLIHIVERHAPQEIHGERHLTDGAEAEAYLKATATGAFSAELHVEWHVHVTESDDVPRSIVEHIAECAPDLIVMCSHGSGGLRGFLFGNIAQQVIGRSHTPVLVIRPTPGGSRQPFACSRLLAPIDGTPVHEGGLTIAAALGQACGAELRLVLVVPTLGTLSAERAATSRLLPGATSRVLEIAQSEAANYLGQRVEVLRQQGLNVTAEVRRGDPTETIVMVARSTGANMIVLGTHGRSGMDAFWAGSTAPKVSARTHLPLLLVPLDAGSWSAS